MFEWTLAWNFLVWTDTHWNSKSLLAFSDNSIESWTIFTIIIFTVFNHPTLTSDLPWNKQLMVDGALWCILYMNIYITICKHDENWADSTDEGHWMRLKALENVPYGPSNHLSNSYFEK